MKIRRFIKKRRRRWTKRFNDQMAARHVVAQDRAHLIAFADQLRTGIFVAIPFTAELDQQLDTQRSDT